MSEIKGFSVKTSINHITIPLEVTCFDEDTQESSLLVVKHILRIPTTEERVQHQKRMVVVKGRKVKSQGTQEANWWLWLRCIIKVEGYTDLEIDSDGRWKEVFDTPILRIHCESAVEQLLLTLGATEADLQELEKK